MRAKRTTYSEVIQYLYELLPAYQRIGIKAFKKDLSNITRLCSVLKDPHLQFPSIHIAGSNGKGSVANMLSSVFQEAGYTTGLYTSPHVSDFRERIQVNGNLIHKNSVIQFVKKIQPEIEMFKPSFFELTVAMAFHHFSRKKVDIAIVETGLGGRLDSTNILHPDLSIITNISLEHQSTLGNTLKKIAGEKAGIIKEQIPVVIGQTHRETSPVFKKRAIDLHCPIHFADKHYMVEKSVLRQNKRTIDIRNKSTGKLLKFQLDLIAEYQVENTITVLTAIDVINTGRKFKLDPASIKQGLKSVTKNNVFKGRWQIIGKSPRVITDGSHNPDGIRQVLQQLKQEKYKQLHIIYGCVNDKDVKSILPQLPADANYYLTRPDVERGKPVQMLKNEFSKYRRRILFSSEDPLACLNEARSNASKQDLILITGSIFLLSSFL